MSVVRTDGLVTTASRYHAGRGSLLHGQEVGLLAHAGSIGNGASRLGRDGRVETRQGALGDVGNALSRDHTGHGNTGNSRDLHFCRLGGGGAFLDFKKRRKEMKN